MKKGFTLVEFILIIAIIGISVALSIYALFYVAKEKASQSKCRTNMKYLGTSMHLYTDSKGRYCFFPADNGSTFLVRLYISGVISESEIFLCPSTSDDNGIGSKLTSTNYTNVGEVGGNYCSYAGRNNSTQYLYPGIFTLKSSSLTSIGSDDFGDTHTQGSPQYNHPDVSIILYLDGHSNPTELSAQAKLSALVDPLGN